MTDQIIVDTEALTQKVLMQEKELERLKLQLKQSTDAFNELTKQKKGEQAAEKANLIHDIKELMADKVNGDTLDKMELPALYLMKTTAESMKIKSFIDIARENGEEVDEAPRPKSVWDPNKRDWVK